MMNRRCILFQEALAYVKRQEYELSLLKYISDEFSAIDRKLGRMKNKKKRKMEEKKEELGKVTSG